MANIEAVLENLKTKYPGGWLNIKNLYLKPMQHSSISLPIYISEINPNQVKALQLVKLAEQLEKFTVT